VPFAVVILLALIFAIASYQPAIVGFVGFVVYALSGYIWSGWLAIRRRRSKAK
jgi:CDP-diacylglycerol--serine O-phosphatidyltransferase